MAQLYFYYSAMNAGKSTTLLQSAFNYEERGMNTMLFTAALDDRFGKGKISSRLGIDAEANLYSDDTNLLMCAVSSICNGTDLDCVLVDECQFLTKDQVSQLVEIVDQLNIPVLCYGLRTDFLGEPFEGSKYLMAWADKMVELKTVCHCGRKATMVLRVDEEGHAVKQGNQVEIGDNDRYVSVCRHHFNSDEAGK